MNHEFKQRTLDFVPRLRLQNAGTAAAGYCPAQLSPILPKMQVRKHAPVLVLSDVRRHRFENCRDGSCAVPAPLNIELYLKGKRTASIIPNLLFLI